MSIAVIRLVGHWVGLAHIAREGPHPVEISPVSVSDPLATVGGAIAALTDPIPVDIPVSPLRRLPRSAARVAAVGAVALAWGAAVTAGSHLRPGAYVHHGALFVHLVSLVAGLGAVIVLDVYGAGSMFGRRSPVTVARLAGSLEPLIWGGLAGLAISGALLAPNLQSPLTWVKLAAVLAAGLNGVNAHGLGQAVEALPDGTSLRELPKRLLWRLLGTAAVSQAAWWIAVLIGFWNNPR
jgi:hypothetical protein